MSTSASSVKLEEVSQPVANTPPEEDTPPMMAAVPPPPLRDQTESNQASDTTSASHYSESSYVPVTPSPIKDRYTRGIVVGIMFSCFVAIIPISIGLSVGTKQQENLTFTQGQVLDLRTNLAIYELNELQNRMADITAAEQSLLALLQDKANVTQQIEAKQSEIRALQQEAEQVRNQSNSLMEQARTELNTTVGNSLSRIAN